MATVQSSVDQVPAKFQEIVGKSLADPSLEFDITYHPGKRTRPARTMRGKGISLLSDGFFQVTDVHGPTKSFEWTLIDEIR